MTVRDPAVGEARFCSRCGEVSSYCQCETAPAPAGAPSPDPLPPLPPDPGPPPDTRRSWRPVDLSDVLAGTYEPPTPTVGARDDGVGLFYAGRVHSIASESEGGKTWLAMLAAAHELRNGNGVAYLDFEDDAGGVVGRLLALSVDRNLIRDRFAYIRPEDPIAAPIHRADLGQAIGDLRPSLVVVDGVTEAMTLHGLELKDNGDVARFGKMLLRSIADQGPAVTALDHVTKDREGRGRYAIGGVHKLNAINGAAYLLDNRQPFGIGVTGRSGVYIAKDRPGQLRKHALPSREGLHWFADLVLESHDATFAEGALATPQARTEPRRPTILMRQVSAALEKAGAPLTVRGVLDRVHGKRDQDVRAALAALVDEGYVRVDPGPRGAQNHTLVKPFGEEA
ncbi:AAA family ATPase [Microbispora siamensis]